MRRATFLVSLAAALLAGGAQAPAVDRSGPRGLVADEIQRIHWSVTAGGRGGHPARDLRDSRTVGFGELLVYGGPIAIGEQVGGHERGKIVHEDERIVGRTLIDDRLEIAFRSIGDYVDAREPGEDAEGDTVTTGFQKLMLHGVVTKSDDPVCPATSGGKPRRAALLLLEGPDDPPTGVMYLDVHACPSHEHRFFGRKRVRVRIFAPPSVCPSRASAAATCSLPQPTRLTLTVNGASETATTAGPSAHSPTYELPSDTPLTINAAADKPMPPGWKLVVYHPGDPLSAGNGDYYKVCEADAGTASCGDTRPGRAGPFDDNVYAQVLSPSRLIFNVQIDIHYDPP